MEESTDSYSPKASQVPDYRAGNQLMLRILARRPLQSIHYLIQRYLHQLRVSRLS